MKLTDERIDELADTVFAKESSLHDFARAIESELAQASEPVRDRESDRQRFPDIEFNRWLDEGISDAGHTVWDSLNDVCDAWHGWNNRQYYPTTPQPAECPTCFNPPKGQPEPAQNGTAAPCPRCEIQDSFTPHISVVELQARCAELEKELAGYVKGTLRINIPTETMEQSFQIHYLRGLKAGRDKLTAAEQQIASDKLLLDECEKWFIAEWDVRRASYLLERLKNRGA